MATKQGRKPRSLAQVEAVRANIVMHALQLFQTEGYSAISMRRLAKEVGCAPMTIYAHFDGKINILQHLWAVVLDAVFDDIKFKLDHIGAPNERLKIASQSFVDYWVNYPDHFRLVFMSSDKSRPDVDSFIKNKSTLAHFKYFSGLVMTVLNQRHSPTISQIKIQSDMLIGGLIGMAFCRNTIGDYPWADVNQLIDSLLFAFGVKPKIKTIAKS
ncbi:MAG: TetR/AcrR family transcriptional regulator [Rhizobiales bacterium]|nr:TetR/AcrR family transcriptional regulator [Hyphomicrobiales bacterium]NRB15133.1 TetR/AcrR family transcriptional regulator [Hyphomicrobiales bacterium]